jgi:hypothetical protein
VIRRNAFIARCHGVRRLLDRTRWIVQQRAQIDTVKPTAARQATLRDKCWIEIEQFNNLVACLATRSHTRRPNDQRHASRFFKKRHLVPKSSVLAQVVSMVAEKHDNCVVPQLKVIDRFQKQRELCVHKRSAGIVGGN